MPRRDDRPGGASDNAFFAVHCSARGVFSDIHTMPFLGSIIPNSVVGVGRLERVKKREDQRKAQEPETGAERASDDAEISARAVDEAEALRSPKGNATEEGHEDRARQASYGPGLNTQLIKGDLDIEG